MAYLRRTLADPGTYRRLLYLLSAFPLGQAWFIALVTVWSLCLGLAITPLVIPLLIGLAAMTRGFATIEATVAGALLDVNGLAPAAPGPGPFWARFRAQFGPGFWRAQAYLMIRWIAGLTVAVLIFSLLAASLGLIFAPAWVPFVNSGVEFGIWHPHTFVQSLALIPAGLVLLPVTMLMVNPLARAFRPIVSALLPADAGRTVTTQARSSGPTPRGLEVHTAVVGVVVSVLVLIWGLTSHGYFWPIWAALQLGVALAIHAWFVATARDESLADRFRGSRALARTTGVAAVLGFYFVAIWAITSRGYFWPIWPIISLAMVVVLHAAAVSRLNPEQAELTERIETLETSRAGVVDVQGAELRRIERDLHDGAQARLVALGMSLGMAEQKLADDPERAGELLAEARAGAEEALRELRDLARGIHPPVLADRGLEAAIAALANSTPLDVVVSADVPERPSSAVESAAYFVVAESLANAAKHAHAGRLDIRIARTANTLTVDVVDDGVGGADPMGSGLRGLRGRVEAIDGTLKVTSPPGGPTAIRAELPCA